MITVSEIDIPLDYDETTLINAVSAKLNVKPQEILSMDIHRKSVDARRKDDVHFVFSLNVSLQNEKKALERLRGKKNISKAVFYRYEQLSAHNNTLRPVVVGYGPAGIFAALVLARGGMNPIVLERGSDIDSRTESVRKFWESGTLDTECNVQFGEGGAGTFSDGKLTTGTKDSRIRFILETFVAHGAPKEILYDAKPHIGTDKLREVVKNIRKETEKLGAQIIFGAKFSGFTENNGRISTVSYEKDGGTITLDTSEVVLAIGHSARDTFAGMLEHNVEMRQKSFAVGVRIEHNQSAIDKALYGKFSGHKNLPPASYKLVMHLGNGRSVYTFCMCPGGKVVNASSEQGMLSVNGMSEYKRDGKNANAAVLVNVDTSDFPSEHPLAGVEFQREIERKAFVAGGSDYGVPVCQTGVFLGENVTRSGTVEPSVLPHTHTAAPKEYLPDFVCDSLRDGIKEFGKKIDGFDAPDSILTGAETRSSSPVRIMRGENLQSVSQAGLYPCGEGAGYAGGIVSAAVDGVKCAEEIIKAHC